MKKQKSSNYAFIGLILIFLQISASSTAQTPESVNGVKAVYLEITGKVRDSTGIPLENMVVEAYDAANTDWQFITVTKTSASGDFRLYLIRSQLVDQTQESVLIALMVKNETGELFYQRELEPIAFNTGQLFEIDISITEQSLSEEYDIPVEAGEDEFHEAPDLNEHMELRNGLIEEALSHSGVPYKWAGSDPRGFDCSGFTSFVFRAKDINIPRTAREQQRLARPVPLEELLPGDLIFFSNGAHVDHVGIVVSNSPNDIEMVHASKTFGISLAGTKTNTYWNPRIHSGGSFLADLGISPVAEELLAVEEPEPEVVLRKEPAPVVRKQRKQRKSSNIKYALGLKAGTYGLGGELVAVISPRIQLRMGGTYMRLDMPINSELFAIKAENVLKTGSVSLLASWQAGDKLYFSGGALYNMFENSITGSPSEGLVFEALTFDPAQVELLTVTMKPGNTISPYFGIGYGRVVSKNKIVSAAIELGGVYHNTPEIGLDTHGALTPGENLEQQQLLQEAASSFKVLPVVNMQLTFKLN